MFYLKKYLTEGLIQAAILLSLCGVQVHVGLDPYLPSSLHEIIRGHTSTPTPAQSQNLHHHGLHSKSVDLDSFFTARRLLGWVRSLDRLQVPHAEVEMWLVQREPGPLSGGHSDQPPPLERPAAVLGMNQTTLLMDLQVRVVNQEEDEDEEEHAAHHSGSMADSEEDDLNSTGSGPGGPSGLINTELMENEEDQTAVSLQECLGLHEDTFRFTEELEDTGGRRESADREPSQCLVSPRETTSVDLELHWQDLLSIMEPEISGRTTVENMNAEMESLQYNVNPRSSQAEVSPAEADGSSRFLQGLPAHHGFLDCPAASLLLLTPSAELDEPRPPLDTETSLNHFGADLLHDPPDHTDLLDEDPSEDFSTAHHTDSIPFDLGLFTPDVMETPSDINVKLPRPLGFNPFSENGVNQDPPASSSSVFLAEADVEDDDLPFIHLLENASIPDEMRLQNGALEEGFSPEMAARLEEEGYLEHEPSPEETGRNCDHVGFNRESQAQPERRHDDTENREDSDSGLSLDFSHSPASPRVSEDSSFSSSSSSASSSTCLSAEESLMGSDMELEMTIKQEELEEEEMGAVGGGSPGGAEKFFTFKPENHKLLQDIPWMEHVGHDHTYNQPWSSVSSPCVVKMTNKRAKSAPSKDGAKPCRRFFSSRISESKMWGRDERRARALRIPFSNELIVNLPVEEFNLLLTKYRLNEDQLSLVKDIRRRGKNKIAAQNCRKRKLDVLLELKNDVSSLRHDRSRLLREKEETVRKLQEMKQQLGELYQGVFSRVKDEQGRSLDAAEHLLHFGPDGSVQVTSHHKEAGVPPTGGKASKKYKDKKK